MGIRQNASMGMNFCPTFTLFIECMHSPPHVRAAAVCVRHIHARTASLFNADDNSIGMNTAVAMHNAASPINTASDLTSKLESEVTEFFGDLRSLVACLPACFHPFLCHLLPPTLHPLTSFPFLFCSNHAMKWTNASFFRSSFMSPPQMACVPRHRSGRALRPLEPGFGQRFGMR